MEKVQAWKLHQPVLWVDVTNADRALVDVAVASTHGGEI
jgi:hypothetical protein